MIKPKMPSGEWDKKRPGAWQQEPIGELAQAWFYDHDQIYVISSVDEIGFGRAFATGPEYHLSMSYHGGKLLESLPDDLVKFVLKVFKMEDAIEVNEVVGGFGRHFWLPVEEQE